MGSFSCSILAEGSDAMVACESPGGSHCKWILRHCKIVKFRGEGERVDVELEKDGRLLSDVAIERLQSVSESPLLRHLAACSKSPAGLSLIQRGNVVRCPFDGRHYVARGDLLAHSKCCPSRFPAPGDFFHESHNLRHLQVLCICRIISGGGNVRQTNLMRKRRRDRARRHGLMREQSRATRRTRRRWRCAKHSRNGPMKETVAQPLRPRVQARGQEIRPYRLISNRSPALSRRPTKSYRNASPSCGALLLGEDTVWHFINYFCDCSVRTLGT